MNNGITFSWDAKKNQANERKHSVSFEEALSVFYDEEALSTTAQESQCADSC